MNIDKKKVEEAMKKVQIIDDLTCPNFIYVGGRGSGKSYLPGIVRGSLLQKEAGLALCFMKKLLENDKEKFHKVLKDPKACFFILGNYTYKVKKSNLQ